MKSAALFTSLAALTAYGYNPPSSNDIHNDSWNMEHIINNQSNHNKHPLARGNTLMADFIIKCLERGVSKGNIVRRAREFYSYTKEVVEEKYNEMEKKFKGIS